MTATDLVTAVADEIRRATANVKLPLEHHGSADMKLVPVVPVNVYEGYLPREAFNDDSYYPLVMVEWLATADELDGSNAKSTATIGLNIGVFAAESWGWKDALHLTEVVRQHLLTNRLVAQKFRLFGETSWEVPPDQPLPFFFTYATLTYRILQVEDLSWRRF